MSTRSPEFARYNISPIALFCRLQQAFSATSYATTDEQFWGVCYRAKRKKYDGFVQANGQKVAINSAFSREEQLTYAKITYENNGNTMELNFRPVGHMKPEIQVTLTKYVRDMPLETDSPDKILAAYVEIRKAIRALDLETRKKHRKEVYLNTKKLIKTDQTPVPRA